MAFPKKFKELIEIDVGDVPTPDYAWLTYAVCACSADACGWGGWMIESVMTETPQGMPHDKGSLSAVDKQKCPECGRETFRTGATVRLEPSADQNPRLKAGVDYEVAPIEYED